MTDPAVAHRRGRTPLRRPMGPRDRDEQDRSATALELLFDLCFVVAVAQAADHLHHALVRGTSPMEWSVTDRSSSPSGGRG